MKIRQGDMFAVKTDVMVVTANASRRADGCLVMGRGAAAQAKQLFPRCERAFGSLITGYERQHPGKPYGVIIHPDRCNPILAIFQVKRHFYDTADMGIISASVDALTKLALNDWKGRKISMNFPGIGWGNLRYEHVMPLISRLPDNVTVWMFEGQDKGDVL